MIIIIILLFPSSLALVARVFIWGQKWARKICGTENVCAHSWIIFHSFIRSLRPFQSGFETRDVLLMRVSDGKQREIEKLFGWPRQPRTSESKSKRRSNKRKWRYIVSKRGNEKRRGGERGESTQIISISLWLNSNLSFTLESLKK